MPQVSGEFQIFRVRHRLFEKNASPKRRGRILSVFEGSHTQGYQDLRSSGGIHCFSQVHKKLEFSRPNISEKIQTLKYFVRIFFRISIYENSQCIFPEFSVFFTECCCAGVLPLSGGSICLCINCILLYFHLGYH